MPVMFAVRGITPLPSAFVGDGSESDGTQLLAGTAAFGAAWSAVEATVTSGGLLAPDGTLTAAEFQGTTNDDRHLIYQTGITIPANTPLTFSVYAKQNQYRYLQFLPAGATSRIYAYFDLQTHTVTDSGIAVSDTGAAVNSTNIQAAVNGFYKCSLNFTIDNSTTSLIVQLALSNVATFGAPLVSNSPQFAGANTTDNLIVWRPKLAV